MCIFQFVILLEIVHFNGLWLSVDLRTATQNACVQHFVKHYGVNSQHDGGGGGTNLIVLWLQRF